MKIIESDLSNHILKSVEKELANIYFFTHIAIIEFNEGIHLDINNSTEIFDELKGYFGVSRPFGVVANRINSYSVKLLDTQLFREQAKNLRAYAVVGHNALGRMSAEIENGFCISDNINYDNIYEAIDDVYSKVKKDILFSLN
ncbi:hypothetical protein SAMN05428642_10415 [Flaviramulus basaltis]|uniref:Uncharacterized protein n=1 Tax=Flaviramulus basaltis TaxID=369401 RepID=A0A1K2IPC2_9FLAO|nr:hypothetical protein [Flaviramulus basaltis]SFZ94231.1 hypothetical protein SAMN05428642_10415 [Flaviramulus basaltis]